MSAACDMLRLIFPFKVGFSIIALELPQSYSCSLRFQTRFL